jgi:hypothetical protein
MKMTVKIILISMAVLVVTGIAYSEISGNKKIKSIKANPKYGSAKVFDKFIPKVTSSTITEVKYQSRYKYEFDAGGKKYNSLSDRYNFFIENQDAIMHKYFPVIYDGNNPENNCILILQRDFAEFGLTQPDSLKHYEGILN